MDAGCDEALPLIAPPARSPPRLRGLQGDSTWISLQDSHKQLACFLVVVTTKTISHCSSELPDAHKLCHSLGHTDDCRMVIPFCSFLKWTSTNSLQVLGPYITNCDKEIHIAARGPELESLSH